MKKLYTKNKSVALVTLASLLDSFVSIISGLLIARWLLPEDLGMFNALSIFTSYIILAQIGIPSGLSRELPFNFGQKKEAYAIKLAGTSKYFMILISFIILGICSLLSIYYLIVANYQYAVGVFVIGVTSAQAFYVTKYLKILYRSDNHFKQLAKIDFINTFVNLLSVYLVYKYLFYGLCLRTIILAIVDYYFTDKWKPLQTKAKFDWEDFKVLSRVGMPIYFVANIYGLWPTFQRTMILSMLGTKGLGIYALANIVQGMLSVFNNSISSISFPKMSLAYGQGKSIMQVLKIPAKLVLVSLAIYSLILVVGWILLPPIVAFFLPNYMAGVEAAQWMFAVALVSSLGIFANIYMVIKKNHHRLISYSVGIGVWLLYILLNPVTTINNLVTFSQALLLGMITVSIVDFCFYFSYWKNENKITV